MTFKGNNVPILPRRGLNDADDPITLEEGFSPDCLNVRFDKRGVYKRDGFTRYIATATKADDVVGIAQLTLGTGANHQVALCGNDLFKEDSGAWSSIKGSLTLTAGQNNHVQFAQLTDLLIGTNNVDQIWKWSGTGNAAALGGSPPTTAKGIAAFQNYLFLLNTLESGTRYPGRVRWSLLNNAENWPAANFNTLLNLTGQVGQGFGKFGNQMFAFFDRSIFEIVYTGDAVTPFTFPVASPDIGSVSGHAIVAVDDAIFFPSHRGIYVMAGGVPKYISAPIEDTWSTINTGRLGNIIGVHNRLYNEVWFAISTGASSSHDKILVYNYVQNWWTVFSGPSINAFGVYLSTIPLAILAGTIDIGMVLRGNSGSYNDDGSAITAYCSTRPMAFGDPGRKRQVKRLQVMLESESSSTAKTQIKYAYDLRPMGAGVEVSMASSGAIYDTAQFDVDEFVEEGQIIAYARPNGHGRMFQAQIFNDQLNVAFRVAEVLAWVQMEAGR